MADGTDGTPDMGGADSNLAPAGHQQAAPAPIAAQSQPTGHAPIGITSEQLKQRLDEEKEKARAAVLREFGFQSITDGKSKLSVLTELQKSQMTEAERLQRDATEAKALASKYEQRAKLFESQVNAEFVRLPETAQRAIDAQANGDADQRWQLMSFMREIGVSATPTTQSAAPAAPAPIAEPAPVPAPVPRPANAGNVPPAPRGAAPLSKYDEWQSKSKQSQFAGDIFYQRHSLEIERTRPANS